MFQYISENMPIDRITGFFDCVHLPVFQKLENIRFRKMDLFLSSGDIGGTYSVGSLRKSRAQTLDKAGKPSNSECYTPLSEPFKIYMPTGLPKEVSKGRSCCKHCEGTLKRASYTHTGLNRK
jgi:hypothetical protein